MSQASKFLSAAAVLLVTVLVIVVSVNIYNKGRTSVNDTTSQYDTVMSQYGDAQLSLYDNGSASGAEVVRFVKTMTQNSATYTVTIVTGTSTKESKRITCSLNSTGVIVVDGLGDGTTVDALEDKLDKSFVNPTANFKSVLTKDDNDIVTDVRFIQSGYTDITD